MVKVHFTGWPIKYDEWVQLPSHRVQKQWKRGKQIALNNRLDVKDVKGKWLEAFVVDLNENEMRVHFKGWSTKWDEWIPIDQKLIDVKYAEIGRFSPAFGSGRYLQPESDLPAQDQEDQRDEMENVRELIRLKEERFRRLLQEKNMEIKEMEGDGNCLFRAISD